MPAQAQAILDPHADDDDIALNEDNILRYRGPDVCGRRDNGEKAARCSFVFVMDDLGNMTRAEFATQLVKYLIQGRTVHRPMDINSGSFFFSSAIRCLVSRAEDRSCVQTFFVLMVTASRSSAFSRWRHAATALDARYFGPMVGFSRKHHGTYISACLRYYKVERDFNTDDLMRGEEVVKAAIKQWKAPPPAISLSSIRSKKHVSSSDVADSFMSSNEVSSIKPSRQNKKRRSDSMTAGTGSLSRHDSADDGGALPGIYLSGNEGDTGNASEKSGDALVSICNALADDWDVQADSLLDPSSNGDGASSALSPSSSDSILESALKNSGCQYDPRYFQLCYQCVTLPSGRYTEVLSDEVEHYNNLSTLHSTAQLVSDSSYAFAIAQWDFVRFCAAAASLELKMSRWLSTAFLIEFPRNFSNFRAVCTAVNLIPVFNFPNHEKSEFMALVSSRYQVFSSVFRGAFIENVSFRFKGSIDMLHTALFPVSVAAGMASQPPAMIDSAEVIAQALFAVSKWIRELVRIAKIIVRNYTQDRGLLNTNGLIDQNSAEFSTFLGSIECFCTVPEKFASLLDPSRHPLAKASDALQRFKCKVAEVGKALRTNPRESACGKIFFAMNDYANKLADFMLWHPEIFFPALGTNMFSDLIADPNPSTTGIDDLLQAACHFNLPQ